MTAKKWLLKVLLKIASLFLAFLSVHKDRVAFIALAADHLTADFNRVYKALNKKGKYDIKLCLIDYDKSLKGQFLYFLNCFYQLYLVRTSRVILLQDNNFVISNFKRKGTVVIQMWHACGAIKHFGNVIDRKYEIANYDIVLATSDYWIEPYSRAFNVKPEQVIPCGLPRTDRLFNHRQMTRRKQRFIEEHPFLAGKKVILYAPTFRGNIYQGFSSVPFDAANILNQLGEDYVILYKFHPQLKDTTLADHPQVYNMNHEDIHALFSVTDILISDYSSIVFNYMILEKPLLFYVPDLDEYRKDIGVFVDITRLFCPVCFTSQDIIQAIQENRFATSEERKELKDRFFTYQDGKSTSRVLQLITSYL